MPFIQEMAAIFNALVKLAGALYTEYDEKRGTKVNDIMQYDVQQIAGSCVE